MPSQFASRRSSELQKRLQRRNISLKPSDFCSSRKGNHLLTSAGTYCRNDNVHHSVLSENRSTDPSTSCKEEGIPGAKEIGQESQENIPEVANNWKERQIEKGGSTHGAASEAVGSSLPRILQTHPTTSKMRQSYLPVAKSSRPTPVSAKKTTSFHHHVEDAEQEYRKMFNAPSLIEVHRKALSDDGVTEVSEITTDIRTRSLRGASYAERRMAGKLQRMIERKHATMMVQPSAFRLPEHEVAVEELEKSSSCVEGDVGDLKHLIQKVEKAKQNLQQSGSTDSLVRRHGLPYETTDFRAEGDDDYSVDPWDGAIRRTHPRVLSPQRDAVDPEDGEVICVRGPPTPRNRPCSETIQSLIRETISSEGDIVIDATEIRDEDLDGVTVLTDSKHPIKASDSRTVSSVLFGEGILDAEDPTLVSDVDDVKQPTKRDFAEAVLTTKAPEPPLLIAGDKTVTTGATAATSKYHDYDSSYKTLEDDSSILVQPDVRKEVDIASDVINSSLGFFKSFAAEIDAQLKHIQRRGLISEKDMDGLLGVLERDMNEASVRIPKEGGGMIVVFGEELEKSTCGAQEAVMQPKAMIPEPSQDLIMFQPKNVENMLDSLKASYKSGLSQCGLDQNLIKDNTKAMEDMVANLKKAYQTNAPVCGGAAQDNILTAAAKQMNEIDKQASSVVAAKTRNLMDGDDDAAAAAVGPPSLHNLVKQLQEQKKRQLQKDSIESTKKAQQLKKEPSEAVEEMLKKAREACNHKTIRLGKLKTKRTKASTTVHKTPEPQTFIVPINMPKKTSIRSVSTSTGQQQVAKGYIEIE